MRKVLASIAALTALLAMALPALADGGGNVMPPTARPLGWSLDDMAAPVGVFNESWSDPALYPATPFQILYSPGPDKWTVKPGTWLYIPVVYQDDAPPWVWPGEPTPATRADAVYNFFDHHECGLHDVTIAIDGKPTTLGPEYTSAPMPLPPGVISLNSGLEVKTIFYVGAFVTPLNKCVHTIELSMTLDGELIDYFLGIPSWTWTATYKVTVK